MPLVLSHLRFLSSFYLIFYCGPRALGKGCDTDVPLVAEHPLTCVLCSVFLINYCPLHKKVLCSGLRDSLIYRKGDTSRGSLIFGRTTLVGSVVEPMISQRWVLGQISSTSHPFIPTECSLSPTRQYWLVSSFYHMLELWSSGWVARDFIG